MLQEFISAEYLPITIRFSSASLRWQRVCGLLRGGWMITGAFWGPPLPVFLLGTAPLYLLSVYPYREARYRVHLSCVVHFLIFTAALLLCTGILALLEEKEIQQIFSDSLSRIWILCAANLSSCLSLLFLRFGKLDLLDLEHERRQDNLFFLFLWCCIVYVYADAFFCLYAAVGKIIPVLLIMGNFLILMLIFVFFQQKWKIAGKKALEEEHEQLEAAKAQEKLRKEELQHTVKREPLTGCYTRRYILREIQELLEEKALFAVAFIDINGLKAVNDRYGHHAGDEMLKSFSRQLTSLLPESALTARIGGDEFLIVMTGWEEQETEKRLKSIRQAMEDPDGGETAVSFSFGVTGGSGELQDILDRADSAMYVDKKRGKEEQDNA